MSHAISAISTHARCAPQVHAPLAHALGNAYAYAVYGVDRIPAGVPLSMPLVLVAWGALLVLLTPACLAWGRLKERRRDLWWLAYV